MERGAATWCHLGVRRRRGLTASRKHKMGSGKVLGRLNWQAAPAQEGSLATYLPRPVAGFP